MQNSCTGTVTATVTQPTSPVSGTTVVTNVACFGGNTGAINLTPTGGTGPYTFNWLPSGPTTEDRTGLVAGTYTVIITDANSCTGTVTATVTQPTSPVSGTTVVTNVACFGGNTGAINLTPTGGTGPYTFNWLPSGPTTEDRTGLVAGTYTVQITDANSCTGTVTATVTQPTSPVSGTTVVTNVACFGGNTGAINLTPTGGTGPYTFNWLPSGPTTEDRTGLVAGTYTVIITDANSCTGTVTATVTQPTAPVSGTTVVTNVSCFGGSNGAIDLTPTGGTPGYTYNWLPSGPTTQDRTGLSAGTYSVIITDANSCTGTVTVTVTAPTAPVSGTAVITNVSCSGGTNGAIDLTPAGGTPGYTYNWLPSGPTTQDRSGLLAGTYTVIITDANSCTGTASFTVTAPTALAGTMTFTNVSCNAACNGTASVTVTGGTAPYTYSWLPSGGNGPSVTGRCAGIYTVNITDFNGCTLTQTVSITEPSPLAVTFVVNNVSCNGACDGSVTSNVTGGTAPYSYLWTPPNVTSPTINGLCAGTYTFNVTDANGCVLTTTVLVTQPPVLTATTSHTDVTCYNTSNGTASVTVSGGTGPYNYTWIPIGGSGPIASNLPAGSYTCNIVDAHGCSLTETFVLTQPTEITASASQTDVLCHGGATGSASFVASGGVPPYTYLWTPNGETTTSVSGLVAGFYTCTVTDFNGCTLSQAFNITEPSAITASISSTDALCNGGSSGTAQISVSGGTLNYSFLWSPNGGTDSVATGLAAGSYTVTVTDGNGCTYLDSVNIAEPSALMVVPAHTNLSCNGDNNATADVSVSGGTAPYTYAWSPSGGNASSATGLSGGTYSVLITDAHGCTFTQTFLIVEPAALVASSSQTNVSCNGGTNGSASVIVTGGTPLYSYAWSSGGNGSTEGGLAAGAYSVITTDQNNCTLTTTFLITEPPVLDATFATTNVLCNGGNDGSITSNVSGGTAPYVYSWQPSGGTGPAENGLAAGCYTFTVTDANACTFSQIICITEPTPLVATVTSTSNPSSCGNTDGSIDLSVSGGTPGYTYLWNNNATTEDLSSLGAGSYSVDVTDTNGCTATAGASLNDPNAPVVTLVLTTDTACSSFPSNVTLAGGSPAGGTWSGPGVTGSSFDPIAAGGNGTYMISYTYQDINGCTGSATDTMFVDVCSGIQSLENTQWAVYPNPTSGNVTFTTASAVHGQLKVEVYAADGRLIRSQQMQADKSITLDFATEPVGIYLVRITGADNSVSSTRIIRQ